MRPNHLPEPKPPPAPLGGIIGVVAEVVIDEGPAHCPSCGKAGTQKTVEVDGERIDVIITCPEKCGRYRI
jgi:hypothetical protein